MNVPLALSVDPQNPIVAAGTETHAFIKLVNDTPAEMELALVIEGTLAAWVVPSPKTIDVAANGEATAALVLQPPADANPNHYVVTVRALDQADASNQAQLSFALTVQSAPPLAAPAAAAAEVSEPAVAPPAGETPPLLLTLNQTAQTSPNSADYLVQVANPTDTATTVELYTLDETNRLALVIDPPQVIVPAQGQVQATLHVSAHAPLTGREKQMAHVITVRAVEPTGGQEAQAAITFVQSQTSALINMLPLILAGVGITLAVLALLILLLGRGNQSGAAVPTLMPLPVTVLPTQSQTELTAEPPPMNEAQPQGVLTAEPLPTNEAQPVEGQPTAEQGNSTIPAVEPSPIVVTAVPLPPTANPAAPGDGTFAITGAVVTVQPEAAEQCPATFLFTAQITASGPGRVQYQWDFSNGQNPPPARLEFRAAGTTVAQTDLRLTESQEGWGRVQFTDPVFAPSNQAAFVVNCAPAPSNAQPATATP